MNSPLQESNIRIATGVMAVLWGLATLGLLLESPLVTWLWPWDGARMTYIWLASIAAAVAAPLAWSCLINEPAALAGTSLDGAAIGSLATIALIVMAIERDENRLFIYAAVTLGSSFLAWMTYRLFDPWPVQDPTPQPRLPRMMFYALVAILIPLGLLLLFRVGNMFPWTLPSETSSLIGGIFIGAATYFAYGLRRSEWVHMGGQLAGLLAYDVVLAVPYWQEIVAGDRIDGSGSYTYRGINLDGSGVNQSSLYVYTAVITVSGIVAAYYLFFDKRTRVYRGAQRIQRQPVEAGVPG